jgi:hypothetical protein
MSASYNFCDGTQNGIDYVRLLIPDTGSDGSPPVFIFQNSEILAFYSINAMQWQSSMFFSGPGGLMNLPATPSNIYRAAALALRTLSGNNARLAAVTQLLDVKLSPDKASAALRAVAQDYLDMDDNSGAFAIAEQVNTSWAFRDRWIAQLQRQTGGGGIA